MKVSEIFGPTIQGEGPFTGTNCSFVRLARCNLSCSWCDTPYTWDWTGKNGIAFDPVAEIREMSPQEILADLDGRRSSNVVISGGEPLVQRRELVQLVDLLHGCAYEVQIETNGTLEPLKTKTPIAYNVSPKLAHSGDPEHLRLKIPVLEQFAQMADDVEGGVAFKFVCHQPADLDEISELVEACGIPEDMIWVMPLGQTQPEVAGSLQAIAQGVIDKGWNLTGRLHVEIWGNRRGV